MHFDRAQSAGYFAEFANDATILNRIRPNFTIVFREWQKVCVKYTKVSNWTVNIFFIFRHETVFWHFCSYPAVRLICRICADRRSGIRMSPCLRSLLPKTHGIYEANKHSRYTQWSYIVVNGCFSSVFIYYLRFF